jgi:membrane glycosyltransferase
MSSQVDGMDPQRNENPVLHSNVATKSGGRSLFGVALASYVFWLLHSFAVRTSLIAIRQIFSKFR